MLKFTERLKTAGVPQGQAVAEAEAVRDALSEALGTTFASKGDLGDLQRDVSEVKTEVRRAADRMDAGFARVDARIDSRFALADSKIDKLSWMLGSLIALNVANFCRQFF